MGIGIEVEGLTKSFGSQRIWQDVTFDLPAGEVSVLLGPSGTGKSVCPWLPPISSFIRTVANSLPRRAGFPTSNQRNWAPRARPNLGSRWSLPPKHPV